MKIISLDSSGLTASVALTEDGNLIAEYNIIYKKTHSQTLLPMLDEIKKMVELDLDTVDAIAISKGPGSFTGLRIGSATAKGLSQALDIPIVEIGTLEGLAANLWGSENIICPMMDARRKQVYTGIYTFIKNENGLYELDTLLEQCAMSVDEIINKVNKVSEETGKRVIYLGDGCPIYGNEIESMAVNYFIAPLHMNRQRAASIAYLAESKLKEGGGIKCFEHAPEYLRLSQAERERNEGIRNKGSNY